MEYTRANLYLEYVSRDIRRLNFICHAENTDLVVFDEDWAPLKIDSYLQEIMSNQHYSIEIKTPVISMRDNIDLKETIALIERQIEEKKLKPELEIVIPPQKIFSELQEVPVKTRSGRVIKKPDRYQGTRKKT